MPTGSRTVLLLVLALALPAGSVLAGASGQAGSAQLSSPENNATTTIVVQVQADGDARWTISTAFDLDTANETLAYRELATDFENGQTSSLGLSAYRRASERASQATEREMSITAVERNTAPESVVQNGTGRLALSFRWTNFGYVEDGQVHVDDVFETPGGMWFPGLQADQTLVVRAPEQYSVFDANVPPSNGTLRWTGPTTFGPDTLDATFTGGGSAVTQTPANGGGEMGRSVLALLGIIGIGAGIGVVYFLTRSEGLGSLPTPATTDGTETDQHGAAETVDSGSREPAAEAAQEEESPAAEDTADETELALLSDEERVERLLEANGGRMKQANIVKETGWSNAKVSQLLSAMEEEGRIDKLRIGRENLISFPDEDVTDFEH